MEKTDFYVTVKLIEVKEGGLNKSRPGGYRGVWPGGSEKR